MNGKVYRLYIVAIAACGGVLLLVLLAACGSADQVPSPTSALRGTTVPIAIATLSPTATPSATATAVTATATSLYPDIEWIEYRNEEYGFALSYPADWGVAELPNKISFTYPGSAVALRILVQRTDEALTIQRTGVPAGDFVEREPVTFLGGTVSSVQLVYEGKTEYVFYDNAGVFERDDLLFALELASNRQPYEAGDIPEWMQAAADGIIESVRWLE